MPRWEPNARDRLVEAAIALFAERGYDATTVDDVAGAAGLTRSTFFRHFRDKAEILFAGQDGLAVDIAAGLAAAPDGAGPLEAARLALTGLGESWFPESRREAATARAGIVAATPALREREVVKRAAIADALVAGLARRGGDAASAETAAQLATLALDRAVRRWTSSARGTYPSLVDAAFAEVGTAARALLDVRPAERVPGR